MDEIQDLSKQIDFNNLVYYFKKESDPKNFISFKGPLAFYENRMVIQHQKKQKKIKGTLNQT